MGDAMIPQDEQQFCDVLDEMTRGLVASRESIQSLSTSQNLDTKDGISLLSLKHHLLLSYMQSLVLTSSHRVLGHSLTDHAIPAQPFSDVQRDARGSDAGDLVDSMVENRIVLEKIKALEGKMRYQIEKLVRLAEQEPSADQNVLDDPLAFRPNPSNLLNQNEDEDVVAGEIGKSEYNGRRDGDRRRDPDEEKEGREGDGIYRPPRLAPVPYAEPQRGKKARRALVPSALTSLTHLDPHVESTSGLGGTPSLESSRAKELKRMTQFEEENFTRLVMKKKEATRRQRDEADLALGGTGSVSRRGRRTGGFEGEFDDVLRSVGRKRDGVAVDGYEELRQRGQKGDALARSRMRSREDVEGEPNPRDRKKGRFERERQTMKKKMSGKMRR